MDLGRYSEKFEELGIASNVAGKYANQFRGKYFVVKAGGEVVTNDYTTAYDLVAMHDLGLRTILVHGGKDRINQKLKEKNLKSEFVEGYRITTPQMMEAVEEALDEVNHEFRKEIGKAGGRSLGLKQLIWAVKHKPIGETDLGLVGEPYYIDERSLMNNAFNSIVVVSPVSYLQDLGNNCNVNADTAASFIAGQIRAEKLIYLTNVDGISIDSEKASEINEAKAEEYISQGHINGGMVPKVRKACDARKNGVNTVHIINGKIPHALLREIFSDEGIGTMID